MTSQNTSSINSRYSVISRRIPAAALSLALGVSIVAVPQATEPAPAVAQEAAEGHVLSPDAVTFKGITDKDGNTVSGQVQSVAHSKYGTDKTGTTINDKGDFKFNFEVDIADAKSGDRLYIQPTTTYTPKYGSNAGKQVESQWVGTRVVGNVPDRPVEVNGTRVGTVDIIHGGGIRVTFNDAVDDMKSGTVKLAATAHSWDAYEDTKIESDRSENEGPLSVKVDSYSKGDYKTPKKTRTIPTDITTKFMSYQQHTAAVRNRIYTSAGAVTVTPKGEGRLFHTRYQAPAGADFEVTLTANRNATDKEASWLMTSGDIKHSVTLYKYDEDGRELDKTSNPDTIKEWAPDMNIEVSKRGSTVAIKATGVPDNYQPIVSFSAADGGPLGVASYQPNAPFAYDREYTPLDETGRNADAQTISTNLTRIPAVADMPENEGTAYARTATVTPMIAGQPKNAGIEVPAPVAGTKQTFEFEVHNTGDTYMAAPEVTLPNGKTIVVEGVKIGPNETGVVQVPYDVPEDATRLDFGVDFPRYTLNAKNHTFRIGPVDHSEEERQKALDDINKNLEDQEKKLNELKDQLAKNNDLTKEQTDAIKDQTKALEDAIGEQKNAIDRLKDAVEKGDKTIADKIDKQTKAINDQTKAINDSLDSLEKTIKDGNEAQLAESKKQTQALKDNTAALREQTKEITESLDSIDGKLADQNEELKKQTAKLQKQVDALNKQAGELEKIKSELAKANELSEEMNNKLQLQIDESKKQTEALNGLIKSNNEQTAMLDKQLGELNETQKLQLKESIKQSIDLSRIADALERRNQILIDQHKDQLKQWDIENGFAQDEQNDRKHSMNLKRCMATDPGTPLLFLIPAGLALMFNMPSMQPLVKSASDQIASLNHNIQKATGVDNMLPADLQKNINNFNKQYGDVARAGGAGMAGLIGAVVSAIAISNLVNNCYADADKSVGRETPEPVKLSDSAFSSRK